MPQCTETNKVDKGTIGIVPYAGLLHTTTCYLSLKNYYSHLVSGIKFKQLNNLVILV